MKLIRFDWAIKKILRHKANFDILEGFLSELLNDDVKIKQLLESESNKENQSDKFNRVDILVELADGELVIVEIQNSQEYDYFHRMLYGTAKVISEHIQEGKPYSEVKKVISITIAYFDLGQGEDYVYHGTTVFKGIHKNDILTLAQKQLDLYNKEAVHEIFPEYWIIKVSNFSNLVKDKLDEWIYFFKNSEIKKDFTARGLQAASRRLNALQLSEEEQRAYKRYLKELHDIASEQLTKMIDAQDLIKKVEEGLKKGMEEGLKMGKEEGLKAGKEEGLKEGKEEGIRDAKMEIARSLKNNGFSVSDIQRLTGLDEETINSL